MSGPGSLLKIGLEAITGKTIKGQAIEGALKKKGVKEDELIYSGIRESIDPNKKYTKEELLESKIAKKTSTSCQ